MTTYEDIIYEERPKGIARITINRPATYNAFRGKTVEELIHAFQRAGWDRSIGRRWRQGFLHRRRPGRA
jgi:2-ketocyclohexanecarboxyl-CoA hydrolase